VAVRERVETEAPAAAADVRLEHVMLVNVLVQRRREAK
jgi:hypothetical protein